MKGIMKRLSISGKLIVGFGGILVLMVISSVLSLYGIGSIGEQVTLYSRYTVPNTASVWNMRRDMVSIERDVLQAFNSGDGQERQKSLDQAQTDGQSLQKLLDDYAGNQRDSRRDGEIKEVRDLLEQEKSIREEISALLGTYSESDIQKADDLYSNQYVPIFDKVAEVLIGFSDGAAERAVQQNAEAASAANTARITLVAVALLSVVLAAVIINAIRKSILTPVTEIMHVYGEISRGNMSAEVTYQGHDELGQMAGLIRDSNKLQSRILGDIIDKFTRIAKGDLRIEVELDYPGDFAALKEAIVHMAESLNSTMCVIDTAAGQVSIGASQVSSGAQELAAGAAEQASSVEELSASATIIADQAEENLVNVQTANHFVGLAGAGVNAGNDHMKQLLEAMSEIGSSSNQITNITKVIEDIAFQTNILALNAAIEAARAGSAGKGFAVVADEVRNLAAKSAEAARQTADLIRNSAATVSKGTEITEKTAQILRETGVNALKVTESFSKIEQASAGQADAIEQIKQGLNQVSAVVETTAATAEENSATSEEMSAQAVTLREEVGKFKLDRKAEAGSHLPASWEMQAGVMPESGKY